MISYTMKKGLQLLVTMFGVVTLVFFSIRLIPGDPAAAIAGDSLSAEALEELREKLGLNAPLWSQYIEYLKSILSLDLGTTITTSLPIAGLLLKALPITLIVAVFTVLLSVIIAIPLGTIAAFLAHKGKKALDNLITWAAMVVDLMPSFWTALLLMLFLSLNLRLFPASGTISFDDPVMFFMRVAMPILVLALTQIATLARITRTAVLEVLNEDYVRTARAMGTSEIIVVFRHALKNAMLPIITVVGLSFGNLLNGTVIVEFIFSIPGIGSLLVYGINSRDYPLVQNVILFYAFVFVAINFLTDLVYKKFDPRVQF
ncbi:ABC transporter permease [Paenibacillus naphthalenovorans]|uniref:ABC transporter permease n=1 Tax=Paenibacillus naphthalenovorans TaxID=162209 RepID=UPI00088B4268|nr:ABC transporter permease [Paenibacillus naphthalenovorans]SDJ31905.1 peptide/nickel transport system permease protein [Paenibacillus naphthalenovorans]